MTRLLLVSIKDMRAELVAITNGEQDVSHVAGSLCAITIEERLNVALATVAKDVIITEFAEGVKSAP